MTERTQRAETAAAAGFLRSTNVVLRGVVRDDLAYYARWLDDSRVTEHLEMGARPTREKDCEAFWRLAQEADDSVVFMIEETASDRVVGTCGLYMIQWVCRRAQINILIGETDVWDKGCGREATGLILDYAFRRLNLDSVQLGVNAENRRAIKSYERAGFVHEGVRRRFLYCNGRYCDAVNMSVLREEYEERAKP